MAFTQLRTLRTSFTGALMFAEIPHIWPAVVEVVASIDEDPLEHSPDPEVVKQALRQLKRLTVIVYDETVRSLDQDLMYSGKTQHLERLDVLVKVNDPRPEMFEWMSRQPVLQNQAAEKVQRVGRTVGHHILQSFAEVTVKTNLKEFGTPDVELTIGRLEPDDSGMRNEPMNVVRARCRKTGRMRCVGLRDAKRWPMSHFVKMVAPAIWRALGGENGTDVALVTEIVVPVECLSDLLREATPQSASRIRLLTVDFMADRLEDASLDVVLPELPALRTVVLVGCDGSSYSFAEVERIIRPIALAASSALEQVRLMLDRTEWTAGELGRANSFASRVVYLPQPRELS